MALILRPPRGVTQLLQINGLLVRGAGPAICGGEVPLRCLDLTLCLALGPLGAREPGPELPQRRGGLGHRLLGAGERVLRVVAGRGGLGRFPTQTIQLWDDSCQLWVQLRRIESGGDRDGGEHT